MIKINNSSIGSINIAGKSIPSDLSFLLEVDKTIFTSSKINATDIRSIDNLLIDDCVIYTCQEIDSVDNSIVFGKIFNKNKDGADRYFINPIYLNS